MDKKKQAASSAALYATLAVCLLAVGLGSYQFIRRASGDSPAQQRTEAVSGAALIPESEQDRAGSGEAGETLSPSDGAASDAAAALPKPAASAPSGGSGAAPAQQGASGAADAASGNQAKSGGEKSGAEEKSASSGGTGGAGKTGNVPDAGAPEKAETISTAEKTGAAGAPGGAASPVVPVEHTALVIPLEGKTVTAFSVDHLLYNETLRDWRTHDGVDIAAEDGAPVMAACAGTVVSVTEDPLFGAAVTLRHSGEYETVYASLQPETEVEAGEEVSAGQILGFAGESAAAEAALGPHLHFSVRENGQPANPEDFLPMVSGS